MELVDRALVPLEGEPAPGDTGVRYQLAHGPRRLTISVPAVDEVWVTVGCRRVRFTAAEAAAIAEDLMNAAQEAQPNG
jgi:hypothetical protein